jgi:uncharacterized protein (TIRG00374 family)
MKRFVKSIRPIHIIILTILVYVAVLIIFDIQDALDIIVTFPVYLFILMLGLALCNYGIRFLKWHYYLRTISVHLPLKRSLGIFLAGFSMTITPAKSGELIKPYLMKPYGYPISHTASVVLAERLTDLLGMIILVVIGAIALHIGIVTILILLGVVAAIVIIIQHQGLMRKIIRFFDRIPVIKNHTDKLGILYDSSRVLTGPVPLGIGTMLSVGSWFFECLCLYVAIQGIGYPVSLLSSVFIFAFSSIAGILAMLPGGLGATEGVMMALLTAEGVPLGAASAATLLARFATLWFAVLIGIIALFIVQRWEKEMTLNSPKKG